MKPSVPVDFDTVLIKTLNELSAGKHIHLVFLGYHNGKYGRYTPLEGFFRSIRLEKGDIEVCIDHSEGEQYNVYIRDMVTGDPFGWGNPTDLIKLKELLEMMKQPTVSFEKYLKSSR